MAVSRCLHDLHTIFENVPLRRFGRTRVLPPRYFDSCCCCHRCCHLITSSELNDRGPSERKGVQTFEESCRLTTGSGVLAGCVSAGGERPPSLFHFWVHPPRCQ